MSSWNKTYHWKTRDCTKFSQQYFTDKFVGTSYDLVSPTAGKVEVESLATFEGDAELGNRKGKLITIYDCQITLNWEGKLESGTEAKGTIFFPEVSHEIEDDGEEYRFETTMTTKSSVETEAMHEAVRSKLAPLLLSPIHKFREQLIQANAKDLGHEDGKESPAASNGASTAPSAAAASIPAEKKESKPKGGSTLSTTKVEVEADLSIRREDLWDLLTNQGKIPMWTRAPAQFSLNPGSHFSLFNDNVTGSIINIEAPSKLTQKWRAPQWPAKHFGTLTTTLTEGESSTKLNLILEGVPLEEEQRSQDALDRFYIAGLKGLGLGTGSVV
ncbi:hypothetical protein CBS101457_005974 [Exobasidium rhododendri]|nr:hypothetical protein CBS101457_005974 [Exobasidium rhododendri]